MTATIQAKDRSDLRRSQTRHLRKEGYIPAVVYGKGKEPITVAVESIELIKNIRDEGRNAVFALDIESDNKLDVMLYDYQSDTIKGQILHADFYQVDMSTEVDVEVNINFEGEAIGVRDGGVKQQSMHAINVRATPNNIPDEITVDISELNIGDSITVGDLKSGKDFEILDEDNSTIISILPPQQASVPEEGEEGADDEIAEPEVINEKSDEEE
ncbi:50S ribosomal protein L25/general stress protein Ctc [Tenuibacillus multivorans]|uniref:Large ribosomal subunit protein bL25 n=1 Tax=Tenuibacillus multivorans TaxID=237069 RepID=A0A1G9VZJ8_9BACI|nr:50S ribosomal protein L25/general stress protein Ctc [Tenuibacillus multivorans]GEL78259.1 general stress protein CTC [Tenuibacillus multivorans]SDM77680.1 large subunit ribosomal protein L25 [Tenuibacillus multivorans]